MNVDSTLALLNLTGGYAPQLATWMVGLTLAGLAALAGVNRRIGKMSAGLVAVRWLSIQAE